MFRGMRTKLVMAVIACLAGLPVTAPAAHAGGDLDGDVQIFSSGGFTAPPGWGCTYTVAPPTVTVSCTLPTISICKEVDVTAIANGPNGTVTGVVNCPGLTATATANSPGSATSRATGSGAPPMTCTATTTGNPAPWVVICHAIIVKVP